MLSVGEPIRSAAVDLLILRKRWPSGVRMEAGNGVRAGERWPKELMETGVDPKENPEVKALS